jgi:hypothetical protein
MRYMIYMVTDRYNMLINIHIIQIMTSCIKNKELCARPNSSRLRVEKILSVFFIFISLFAITPYLPQQSYQQTTLSSELILSTRHFFDLKTGDMKASGQNHSAAIANFHLNPADCSIKSLAVYVHGVWADEQEAKDQYNRLKDSYQEALKTIDPGIEPMPVILYSWDSNTQFDREGRGWRTAKAIADNNGQFLANSILKISDNCNSNVGIHIIAHSQGARVVLSALHDLNNTNFKLESIHLMGAAVDDEEVSKNPNDNQDSNHDDGIVYGDAIEKHVKKFYNLFNLKDDLLRQSRLPYTYYPNQFYEGDTALGNLGIDSRVKLIDRPQNYTDVNVQNEIPENTTIDFTDADGNGKCDLIELIGIEYICGIHEQGNNHKGYMGFRDNISQNIVDDGVMDNVARDWIDS